MADQNRQDAKVLNNLIERLIDSIDGYEKAAESTDRFDLAELFKSLASERRRIVETFKGKVRALGEEPEDDGSILAAAHRAFLSLRTSLQSDAKAAIAEVERGEDKLTDDFAKAAANDDVSPAIRAFIAENSRTANRDHNRIEDIKRAMAA